MKKFSSKEAIRFGWNTMKSNLGFFIALLLTFATLFYIAPYFIRESLKESKSLSATFEVVYMAISIFIQIGLIKIALRFCDNEKGRLSDLYTLYPLFLKYLIASILYWIIIMGGFILLIVPGIILAIKFHFYGYFIVDKGCGPVEALKKSSTITIGSIWNLFLFFLLLIGINILGAICLLIGLFATYSTAMVAHAFVYRKLLSQIEDSKIGDVQVPGTVETRSQPSTKMKIFVGCSFALGKIGTAPIFRGH